MRSKSSAGSLVSGAVFSRIGGEARGRRIRRVRMEVNLLERLWPDIAVLSQQRVCTAMIFRTVTVMNGCSG